MSHIAVASLAAEWTGVAITAIGLGSLISQIGAFQNLLDPFHESRGHDKLGPWANKNKSNPFFALRKDPPTGPNIESKYTDGFCGLNIIHVTRKPVADRTGKASWTAIFAVFHPSPLSIPTLFDTPCSKPGVTVLERVVTTEPPRKSWEQSLSVHHLVMHRGRACTRITRKAFITCLLVTNSYQIYKYSDAAGLRVAYSGYSGAWELRWPLGSPAELEFFPLDSHEEYQEMHPPSFRRRVDKCILMLLGIIESKPLGKLAFPEPRESGRSILELHSKGFHSDGKTTHLFNMMGGSCYDVDYLYRRTLQEGEAVLENEVPLMIPTPELDLNRKPVTPWDRSQAFSTLFVPRHEQVLLATALDCLPWCELGWSMHRGMQNVLVAFGERVMRTYRPVLARTLKKAIEDNPERLESQGWNRVLVFGNMAENAANSVMAIGGDSGDSVRIVTAAARLLSDKSDDDLDETQFWRNSVPKDPAGDLPEPTTLDADAVIALTKLFVLEWSNELDHRLYEDLPLSMLVA
ncbi:MAG: hypothetical protein Q9163_005534 [Psora crenata]